MRETIDTWAERAHKWKVIWVGLGFFALIAGGMAWSIAHNAPVG